MRVSRGATVDGVPVDGTVASFIDHCDQSNSLDFANPKYLALRTAIAGIVHAQNDIVEHIDKII